MITAKTKDGFAVELSEEALDNVELLDALAAVQDLSLIHILRHRPQSCSFPGVIWFMSFASPRPTLTNGRAALWSFSGRDGES